MKYLKIIFILLLLTGCSLHSDSKDVEIMNIAVSLYDSQDPFVQEICNQIKEDAKRIHDENNIQVQVDLYFAQVSQTVQNKQVDDFVRKRYDAILINLVDRSAASTIINKTSKKNIPLIFFNREPVDSDMKISSNVYYVGSESSETGYMQGEMIADAYEKDPISIDRNGDGIIQYVLLEGEQSHQDSVIRSEMCLRPFEERNIAMEELDRAIANWSRAQGKERMSEFIKKYNHSIEVVFSNNDEMAIGAIYEIENANLDIKVAGVDGIKDALDYVKQGKLYGTVLNDAKEQGNIIMNLAYKTIMKQDVKDLLENGNRKVYTHPTKIMSDNVDEFMKE